MTCLTRKAGSRCCSRHHADRVRGARVKRTAGPTDGAVVAFSGAERG